MNELDYFPSFLIVYGATCIVCVIPPGEVKAVKHDFKIALVSLPNYFTFHFGTRPNCKTFNERVDPSHHTLPLGFGEGTDTQLAKDVLVVLVVLSVEKKV